jgi:hypothetical protein
VLAPTIGLRRVTDMKMLREEAEALRQQPL